MMSFHSNTFYILIIWFFIPSTVKVSTTLLPVTDTSVASSTVPHTKYVTSSTREDRRSISTSTLTELDTTVKVSTTLSPGTETLRFTTPLRYTTDKKTNISTSAITELDTTSTVMPSTSLYTGTEMTTIFESRTTMLLVTEVSGSNKTTGSPTSYITEEDIVTSSTKEDSSSKSAITELDKTVTVNSSLFAVTETSNLTTPITYTTEKSVSISNSAITELDTTSTVVPSTLLYTGTELTNIFENSTTLLPVIKVSGSNKTTGSSTTSHITEKDIVISSTKEDSSSTSPITELDTTVKVNSSLFPGTETSHLTTPITYTTEKNDTISTEAITDLGTTETDLSTAITAKTTGTPGPTETTDKSAAVKVLIGMILLPLFVVLSILFYTYWRCLRQGSYTVNEVNDDEEIEEGQEAESKV